MQITIKARNIPNQYLKALKDKKDQGWVLIIQGQDLIRHLSHGLSPD